MKKLFFTSILLLYAVYSFSQSLSGPSSPVATGSVITITATGEFSSGYFSSITFNPTLTTSSSPGPTYYSWITASIAQHTNSYNITTQQPTTFTMNVANTSNQSITIKFGFDCVVYNFSGGGISTNVVKYVTLTVNPVYRNVATSSNFTRNNCATGGTPSTVTYTVSANTYTSTISQADADSKVTADISANGQAYANSNGTCTFYGVAQSGNFTQSYCALGTPDVLPYSIAAGVYTSLISQADADSKAANALATQGQYNADTYGTCGGTKPVIYLSIAGVRLVNLTYTVPYSIWYGSITLRDDYNGQVTTTTYGSPYGSFTVPYSGRSYTFTLKLYSSTFPSGVSSDPVTIYVP